MGCEEPLMQCVMNHPEVAGVGLAAGFIIAKAMGMRNKNRGFGGGGF